MDTVTEQWLKYAVEADEKCSEAIYCFFTSTTMDYPELNRRLEDGFQKLYRAKHALGQCDASKYGVTNAISFLERTMEQLDGFANTMHLAVFQELEEDYGHPYERAWSIVKATTPASCAEMVEEIEELLSVSDVNTLMERLDRVLAVDPYKLLMCIWSCAIAQPYSARLFSRAIAAFEQLFHETPQDNPDIAAACLYVQKQHAGDTAVLDELRKILDQGNWGAAGLRVLASAADWLQCYEAEKSILQKKLSMNLEMEPIEQKRLKALSQGNNNAPARRKTAENEFSFDIAALSWSDEAYKEFFEQLQQRGEQLNYSFNDFYQILSFELITLDSFSSSENGCEHNGAPVSTEEYERLLDAYRYNYDWYLASWETAYDITEESVADMVQNPEAYVNSILISGDE